MDHQKRSIVFFVIIFSLLFLLLGFLLLPFLQMINTLYPSVFLTSFFVAHEQNDIPSYSASVKFNTNPESVTLFVEHDLINDFSKGTVLFPFHSNNSLGSIIFSEINYSFFSSQDRIIIVDSYDGSFHLLNETIVPEKLFLTLYNFSSFSSLYSFLEHTTSKTVEKKGNVLFMSYTFDDLSIPVITLAINTNDYRISSILFSFNGSRNQIINISYESLSFQMMNASRDVELSSYGDFYARESILLRTNDDGNFDYLWPLWEQAYYNCTQCVNRYGDSDDDYLTNIMEFILQTNPFEDDAVLSLYLNDGGNFKTKNFSSSYDDIVTLLLFKVYNNSYTRSPMVRYSILLPNDVTTLSLNYSFFSDSGDSDYVLFFLNKTLIHAITPLTINEFRRDDIDISSYSGKGYFFYVVLNSVGKKGTSFFIAEPKIDGDPIKEYIIPIAEPSPFAADYLYTYV